MEKRKEEETSTPSNSINPEEIFCFCGHIVSLKQWCSDLCVHQNHLESLKHEKGPEGLHCWPSSQAALMLLVRGPHSQNHWNNWRSCGTFPGLHSRYLSRADTSLDFLNLGSFETNFSGSHLVLLTWWNSVSFQPEETSWEKTGCKGCGEKDEAIKRGNRNYSIIIINANF